MDEKKLQLEKKHEESLARVTWIKRIIAILAVVLVVGFVGFNIFKITTEARLVLRESKNVKLALEMLDIEYYGEGKSIYDANRKGGLASGVDKYIYEIMEQDGETSIISYDRSTHEILQMTYEKSGYRVTFSKDDSSGQWKVDYLVTVLDYTN